MNKKVVRDELDRMIRSEIQDLQETVGNNPSIQQKIEEIKKLPARDAIVNILALKIEYERAMYL